MTTQFELLTPSTPATPPQPWSEARAQQLAELDGVGKLGEAHWRVIHTLRSHFIQYGALPPMRLACSASHLDPHCVEQLFHTAREAWTIAGLPDPGDEVRSYL